MPPGYKTDLIASYAARAVVCQVILLPYSTASRLIKFNLRFRIGLPIKYHVVTDRLIRLRISYLLSISEFQRVECGFIPSADARGTAFLTNPVVTTRASAAAALKLRNSGKEAPSQWR
jgi:hypothetical protein